MNFEKECLELANKGWFITASLGNVVGTLNPYYEPCWTVIAACDVSMLPPNIPRPRATDVLLSAAFAQVKKQIAELGAKVRT